MDAACDHPTAAPLDRTSLARAVQNGSTLLPLQHITISLAWRINTASGIINNIIDTGRASLLERIAPRKGNVWPSRPFNPFYSSSPSCLQLF